jgi:GT2 family glycosyltransferase
MDRVDIIVPVHRGLAATQRCLDSLHAAQSGVRSETVVIDDATPEPEIARFLDGLASGQRITLLRNDANEGFVRSVNRGMALHRERDVVLLNSDTEVTGDWLDRLRQCAYASPDIGTATPFSNNATICSYPFDGWSGGVPGTLGLAALDRLFAATNARQSVDLPTGVGSCLFIRRACLDEIGAFDAERFGRGYGEENDFCLRALAKGWRSVLAADVFVFHEGAVSFAGEREERTVAALAALLAVHPGYPDRVRAFVAADPIRPLREAIDVARLDQAGTEARRVLAERAAETSRLKARVAQVEALAEERAAAIAELRAALAHAEAVVAAREPEFAKLRTEIDNLRAGLSHAEKLATERMNQLSRIHASFIGRIVTPWFRKK